MNSDVINKNMKSIQKFSESENIIQNNEDNKNELK